MSKYTAALDYTDTTLIALSATSGETSNISFTNVIGASNKCLFNYRSNKKAIIRNKKKEEKTVKLLRLLR